MTFGGGFGMAAGEGMVAFGMAAEQVDLCQRGMGVGVVVGGGCLKPSERCGVFALLLQEFGQGGLRGNQAV